MPKYNLKATAGFTLFGIVRFGVEGGVEWGDKPTRSFTDQFEYVDDIRKLRNDVCDLRARLAIFEDALPRLLTMRSRDYPGYRRLLYDAEDATRGSGLDSGVISLPRKTLLPSALTNLSVINPQRVQQVRYCRHPGCKNLALFGRGYCFMHLSSFSAERAPSAPSVPQTTYCRKFGCKNVAFVGGTCLFHAGVALNFTRNIASPLKQCKHPGCTKAVVSSMDYCLTHSLVQKLTMQRCKQPGCTNKAVVDGNCFLHSGLLKSKMSAQKRCTFPGCTNLVFPWRDYCFVHSYFPSTT